MYTKSQAEQEISSRITSISTAAIISLSIGIVVLVGLPLNGAVIGAIIGSVSYDLFKIWSVRGATV